MEPITFGAAVVGIINAFRELIENKNWHPLMLFFVAGAVGGALSFIFGIDVLQGIQIGFGASGSYTLVTKVGNSPISPSDD